MKRKTPYRIRNWSQYNAALVGRGSLTLWVDEAALAAWRYTGPTQRGAQYVYAEAAISCVLTLRTVYHLALRATEGLARSVFALLEVTLPVPSYSTLSRRAADLTVALGALPRSTPLHLVIDSSGFKAAIPGQGGRLSRARLGARATDRKGPQASFFMVAGTLDPQEKTAARLRHVPCGHAAALKRPRGHRYWPAPSCRNTG